MTKGISVADWVAEFSQTPKPTAASPEAAIISSTRIFELLSRGIRTHATLAACLLMRVEQNLAERDKNGDAHDCPKQYGGGGEA